MAVCVGAMMVGSIQTTLEEGDDVKRGQEFGYFAFGMRVPLSLICSEADAFLRWIYHCDFV